MSVASAGITDFSSGGVVPAKAPLVAGDSASRRGSALHLRLSPPLPRRKARGDPPPRCLRLLLPLPTSTSATRPRERLAPHERRSCVKIIGTPVTSARPQSAAGKHLSVRARSGEGRRQGLQHAGLRPLRGWSQDARGENECRS